MYDIFNHTWTTLPEPPPGLSPSPRYDHAATTYGDQLLVYGGANATNILGDFWAFDFERSSWKLIAAVSPPGSRFVEARAVVSLMCFMQD